MSAAPLNTGFSRRGFLGLAGLAVTTAGLAACGGGGTSGGSGGAAASAGVKLPTYKEFTGVTADLAGNSKGLQAAFFKLPEGVTSVKEAPLKGKVTGLTETFDTMSPGMKDNPFWQRLNAKLGGELELQIAEDIGDGYPAKFATVLASDDLPDMMWVPPNQGIPNVGPMLEAKFQDLTKYLSGDAVLEYPNLAALKPDSWKTAVVNGKIWGAPIPSTPFGQIMSGRRDVWEKVGGLNAASADEFLEKAKELTRPAERKYALEPAYVNVLHMVTEWFGAPNSWAVNKDRTLTHLFETGEYAAGVEFTAKLFAAGVFYPDVNVPTSATASPMAASPVKSWWARTTSRATVASTRTKDSTSWCRLARTARSSPRTTWATARSASPRSRRPMRARSGNCWPSSTTSPHRSAPWSTCRRTSARPARTTR